MTRTVISRKCCARFPTASVSPAAVRFAPPCFVQKYSTSPFMESKVIFALFSSAEKLGRLGECSPATGVDVARPGEWRSYENSSKCPKRLELYSRLGCGVYRVCRRIRLHGGNGSLSPCYLKATRGLRSYQSVVKELRVRSLGLTDGHDFGFVYAKTSTSGPIRHSQYMGGGSGAMGNAAATAYKLARFHCTSVSNSICFPLADIVFTHPKISRLCATVLISP